MESGFSSYSLELPRPTCAMRQIRSHGSSRLPPCPLGDIHAFSDAIGRLASAPLLRARMGAFNRGRAIAEFEKGDMLRKYRRLFEKLAPEVRLNCEDEHKSPERQE